jgi:DNA-binding transcriptional ArsR family regulator
MPTDERSDDELSRVFAALGDPTRRALVARLSAGDATVGELAEPHEMSMQAISKHLNVLSEAGLVTKTKDAQRRIVHLEAEVFDLMTKWIERYRRQAEQRYQRLDAVLNEMNETESSPRTTRKRRASGPPPSIPRQRSKPTPRFRSSVSLATSTPRPRSC